ncbi:MAG: hypothetical protein WA405_12055 [Candidatus Acidiferrales bacterium]
MKVKAASTKKVMSGTNIKPSWESAIADAEERIARLHRSIEAFKQNSKDGIPYPFTQVARLGWQTRGGGNRQTSQSQ